MMTDPKVPLEITEHIADVLYGDCADVHLSELARIDAVLDAFIQSDWFKSQFIERDRLQQPFNARDQTVLWCRGHRWVGVHGDEVVCGRGHDPTQAEFCDLVPLYILNESSAGEGGSASVGMTDTATERSSHRPRQPNEADE